MLKEQADACVVGWVRKEERSNSIRGSMDSSTIITGDATRLVPWRWEAAQQEQAEEFLIEKQSSRVAEM